MRLCDRCRSVYNKQRDIRHLVHISSRNPPDQLSMEELNELAELQEQLRRIKAEPCACDILNQDSI